MRRAPSSVASLCGRLQLLMLTTAAASKRPFMSRAAPVAMALVAASALLTGASAQTTPVTQLPPAQPSAASAPQAAGQPLPPQLLLGQRLAAIRARTTVLGTIVIVSDAPSYLAAIGAWSDRLRFPILIDDGTPEAREDIARFARAFRPARVLRFGPAPSKEASATFAAADTVAVQLAHEQSWDAVAQSAGSANPVTRLASRWRELGHVPPGVVLATANDPAWAGGLALAAGWGQPFSFVGSGQDVNSAMQVKHADGLEKIARDAATASGLTWDKLGDELEAVTLAMNVPARISNDDKDFFALTDRVGRSGDGLKAGARWAWCGQLFGSSARGVYRAMSSLFVQPEAAWIFDSYAETAPWNTWDGTQAKKVAESEGWPIKLAVTLFDTPNNTAAAWRTASARPLDAGLVLVNTMGNWDYFDLQAGRRVPGDIPIQRVPTMVHMVHSWSARNPADRTTVGGRWLDQGSYVYVGSVHEPFLQAFVPTPQVMGRLLAGAPIGAAVRQENAQVWRVTTLGDPLAMIGAPMKRDDDTLPRLGTADPASPETPAAAPTDIAQGLREALTAAEFELAFEILILQGRDAEVARLAATLLLKPDAKVPARAWALAVLPLIRENNIADGLLAFSRADATMRKQTATLDGVWLAIASPDAGLDRDAVLDALRASPRKDSFARDALALAGSWSRVRGEPAARTMLRSLAEAAPSDAARKAITDAATAPASTWSR